MKPPLALILFALAGCQTYQYETFVSQPLPAKAEAVKIPILYEEPKVPYVVIGRFMIETTSDWDAIDAELEKLAHKKGADEIFVFDSGERLVTKKINDRPRYTSSPRKAGDPPPKKGDYEEEFFSKMDFLARTREGPTKYREEWQRFLRAQFIVFLKGNTSQTKH